MKIAIHQPQYLPWIGYFDKMDRADVLVLLDDVQYKKNEWQNRNRIRNARGWQWITVPVTYDFGDAINAVRPVEHEAWRKNHMKSLETNYAAAPHFSEYMESLAPVYAREWDDLAGLNSRIIDELRRALGIRTRMVSASALQIKNTGTQRLVDICRELDADTYIAGAGASDYMDEKLFAGNGISLEVQKYEHPVYEQVYDGFEPFMSVVDLLFCHGKKSLEIIRSGRKA